MFVAWGNHKSSWLLQANDIAAAGLKRWQRQVLANVNMQVEGV
jgi:hypothetical protein